MSGHPDASAITVVVVCAANICRSPAAAALLRTQLDQHRIPATVISRGAWARPGEARCTALPELLGAVADDELSTPLTIDDLATADLVLTAELSHRAAAVTLYPRCRSRAFTLLEIAALSRWWDNDLRAPTSPTPKRASEEVALRSRWWFAELDAARGIGSPRPGQPLNILDPHSEGTSTHAEVAPSIFDSVSALVDAWVRMLGNAAIRSPQ